MINQHNKKGENLKRLYFLVFLFVLSSCKLTKPRGGFVIQLTAEKITDHNVRIKILDASTGLPLQVTYIVFKKKRKLESLTTYQGELTLKIPNRRTWIRTAAIPYYHNEFVIKPHKTNVIEVISYQVPDTKPLYCK
jgi:hypothetical protein